MRPAKVGVRAVAKIFGLRLLPTWPGRYLCEPCPKWPGMHKSRYINTLFLLFIMGTMLSTSGCASNRHYGASPHKKRGCDCPKWNAVPAHPGKGIRVETVRAEQDLALLNDASRH